MPYTPRPIPVDDVPHPAELAALTEQLAENVHDRWAQGRLREGWTPGPRRDDARREHPCLVAYADLPESEKAYDRETALGTLKAILALGYEIHSPRTSGRTKPGGDRA